MSTLNKNTPKEEGTLKRNTFLWFMCIFFILLALLFVFVYSCFCSILKQLETIKQGSKFPKFNQSAFDYLDVHELQLKNLHYTLYRQSRLVSTLQSVTKRNAQVQQRLNDLQNKLSLTTKQQKQQTTKHNPSPQQQSKKYTKYTHQQDEPLGFYDSFVSNLQSSWGNVKNSIAQEINNIDENYQLTEQYQFIQSAIQSNRQYLKQWFIEQASGCGRKTVELWGILF